MGIDVTSSNATAFVERFGPLFEHSPWVAADAWSDRPFADRDELFEASGPPCTRPRAIASSP